MYILRNWDAIADRVRNLALMQRIVVAAAHDAHALEAVHAMEQRGMISPVLVGDEGRIRDIAARIGMRLDDVPLHHEPDEDRAAAKAVQIIREGHGDVLMKGILQTAQLLKAVVNKEHGLGTGRLMSHVAFQEVPRYHKMLVTTDSVMIPYPTLEQKKGIILNAVGALHALGYARPKVAVLAAVEKAHPKMPETQDAAALKEMNRSGEIPRCVVEGPISMDLALVAEKARIKGYESAVAGDSDILVMHDLCCANCVGKALTDLAGARTGGLIIGARVPIVLTSRSASAEEKGLSLILAAASAAGMAVNPGGN